MYPAKSQSEGPHSELSALFVLEMMCGTVKGLCGGLAMEVCQQTAAQWSLAKDRQDICLGLRVSWLAKYYFGSTGFIG